MTNTIKIALIAVFLVASVSAVSAQRFDATANSQSPAYDDMAQKNKTNLGEIGG